MSATPIVFLSSNRSVLAALIASNGTYEITAYGAQGGDAGPYAGGLGAEVSVDVTLTAGTVLDILVGGQGAAGVVGGAGGGGGGGSFVAEANGTATPALLVAAGGGGGAFDTGVVGEAGANASGGPQGTSPGGGAFGNVGGTGGAGGHTITPFGGAGGGGGFTGDGQADNGGPAGGLSFLAYLGGQTNAYAGGYGGGGQGAATSGAGGGGGGGYSGGGAGGKGANGDAEAGGGGGSYVTLAASAETIVVGARAGNGLVEIVPVVACFAAGTRIATPDGVVAVERLAVGDAVLTRGGGVQSVIWMGHRTLDCRRHPRPEQVWPVRVAADAFGPGLPSRPLFLSPDHALFIDGVLIPVKYLVDGHAIARCPVEQVTYYHVELPCHDLLLAEGLAAESYLDDGARGLFAETAGAIMLHPDFATRAREASGCAPLVVTGPAVAAARARLAGEPPGAAARAA